MQEIQIYCDQGHSTWIIATMFKADIVNDGQWQQITPVSKEREREIMADDLQRISKGVDHAIVEFMVKGKLDPDGLLKEVAGRPEPDKPVSYTYIYNGENIGEYPPFRTNPGDDLYLKYEFGCPKCHGDSKPLQRRESKLIPVLDALAETGVEAVSYKKLSKWCTYYDKTR